MMPSPSTPPGSKPSRRFFIPILAGATLRDRLIACIGAIVGISLTGLISGLLVKGDPSWPLIVGPVAASTVLIFAIPSSPLAQPWPIIGGNTISALVGVTVAHLVHEPILATGVAVSLAILVMSLTRCLHPPGGATALIAVIGGPAITSVGYLFALVPIALNSIVLVCLGLVFHRVTRRSYPHVSVPTAGTHQTADPPAERRVGFREEDIDAALADLNETFDIDRGDLDRLLRRVELQALVRARGDLLCKEIMSRDVVSADVGASPGEARLLLLRHNIRTLPVIDGEGRLVGTVGLRELAEDAEKIWELLVPAATAAPGDPALGLLPALTNGRAHAVVIVDPEGRVVGLITQADLLAVVARMVRQ